ncbi:hypothetical protein cypCar_00017969 [Cyprinus carpio]|nr:hypothetical protein cypCar_00017969 [Cyprinus carpio]
MLSHQYVLLSDGHVYSFGEQPWKRVESLPAGPVIESVLSGQRVISVSAGSYHCSALTEDGLIHMWGENSHGQCGVSGMDQVSSPTPVSVVDGETHPPQLVRVLNVACGAQHTLALSRKHEVWAWGSGCQLGLVTSVFPVWKPQKVEHLVGRYVDQIACGGFHSLALVQILAPPEDSQQARDRCGQCKQSLFTMTDKDDHVIISDEHYCPLGVELNDSKEGRRSGQSSPAQTPQSKNSSPHFEVSPLSSKNICEGSSVGSQKNTRSQEAQPDPSLTETGHASHRQTKSTPYPDEQALQDYLKRISDQTFAEQAEAPSLGGSHPPSHQSSLTCPFRSDQSDELTLRPSSPALSGTDSITASSRQRCASNTTTDRKHSTSDDSSQHSSVDGGICISDLVISNGCLFESCEDGVGPTGMDFCPGDPLQGKKSTSLTDITLEDTEAHNRRGSLPGFSPVSPSGSHRINHLRAAVGAVTTTSTSESRNLLPSLYTEVWSWGRGQEGQLGHGDYLPRLQPLCIKSLSKKEVVKITAGANHSLALTAQCQVYSWGSDKFGQLGRMNAPSTVPNLTMISEGIRVWDVAAGQTHTLLLADGDCYQPILYYSGEQIGYVSKVFGGGLNCLALADQNAMGFIATIHELASAERKFYCTLSKVKSGILSPLLARTSLALSLGPSSMLLFQEMAGSFSKLCHLMGQHSVSLTNFLQRGKVIKTLVLIKNTDIFMDTYKEYCDPVGNFLVMGGFQSLLKPSQECFGKKLELIQTLLESKEKNTLPYDLLVNLFYMPLQHLHGYNRLLLKLAHCFEVSTEEYEWIQNGCSKYEDLARLVSKQRRDAEATFSFWKNFKGKNSDSLRKPSRRLVCESNNKALALQNAGRFSASWFILFNDVLAHAQGTIPSKKLGKWLRAINQAIEGVLAVGLNGRIRVSRSSQKGEPPVSRTSTYTFSKEGRLKDATYEGRWLSGKLHGKGTLKWPDGTVYCGTFKNGLEDGFGDFMMPNTTFNKFERYQGHWKEGKIHGFGKFWYASGEVYEGSFRDNMRHGHGMLRSGKLASPSSSSVFVGQWVQGKRTGYGVCDDFSRGEKYIGMWLDDQRHGDGVVITQFGLYYEGNFCNNKMMGNGTLLCDDDTVFEGEFSEDWTLCGKGVLFMPNGDSLDGVFDGHWGAGLRVAGTFTKPFEALRRERKIPVAGQHAVPAEEKWKAVFDECWSRLGCETPGEGVHEKAWENIAIALTARRRQPRDRFLFPGLPEDGGFILDSSSSSDEGTDPLNSSTHLETPQQGWIVSSSSLLLPVLLPRLYPPLFTLYTLEKEREEEVYWSCVLRLNKQPDLALLAFLAVQDTAFTPSDKLQVIQLTFEEVTQEVQALLGKEFLWCMDDLFPIFLYVVLRARIRNLGSEVSLIEDLTDGSLQLGQLGFMLTTLKACYNQIQLEKTT